MTLEDYNVLNEMLLEFRRESAEVDAQIDYNLRCIREAEAHLKSFSELESDDFKVFSPRKIGITYKEEIEKINSEKAHNEDSNRKLCQRKKLLKARIFKLEGVLSRQSHDFTAQTETVGELYTATVQGLEELMHKINVSSGIIDRNPIQARQDFAIIGKCLREIVDKWKNSALTF